MRIALRMRHCALWQQDASESPSSTSDAVLSTRPRIGKGRKLPAAHQRLPGSSPWLDLVARAVLDDAQRWTTRSTPPLRVSAWCSCCAFPITFLVASQ